MNSEQPTDQPGKDGKFADERYKKGKISRRDMLFAENLLQGMSAAQAARNAGFKESVANSRANEWIRESRERSKKPALWDYYQERKKTKLRLFDISVDNVLNELKLIGFSSIDKFVTFPTKEEMLKARAADAVIRDSIGAGDSDDMAFKQLVEKGEIDLSGYQPGRAIKLKCLDEIPPELLPAIAEIHETKEGIRVKLHSKLDALDKLARYLKLYEDGKAKDDEALQVKEINIVVNGSKSPLMFPNRDEDQAKAAS